MAKHDPKEIPAFAAELITTLLYAIKIYYNRVSYMSIIIYLIIAQYFKTDALVHAAGGGVCFFDK